MAKNIVVCLDGTNNQLRAAVNTNVVRLFNLRPPRYEAKAMVRPLQPQRRSTQF